MKPHNTRIIQVSSIHDLLGIISAISGIPDEDRVPMPTELDSDDDESRAKRERDVSFALTEYQKGCIDQYMFSAYSGHSDKKDDKMALKDCCQKLGIDKNLRKSFDMLVALIAVKQLKKDKTELMLLDVHEELESQLKKPRHQKLMEMIRDSSNPDKDSAKAVAFKFPDVFRPAIHATVTLVVTSHFTIIGGGKLAGAAREMFAIPLKDAKLAEFAKKLVNAIARHIVINEPPEKWSPEYVESVIAKMEDTIGTSRYSVLRSALLAC